MQAIDFNNSLFANFFSRTRIKLNEIIQANTGTAESNADTQSSIMVQSMHKVRVMNNRTDTLELTQNAPGATATETPSPIPAVPIEPIPGIADGLEESSQDAGNVMEKYKLKIMGRDENGDKFKLMLRYFYKEVGANNVSQTKLNVLKQGDFESLQPPADNSPDTEPQPTTPEHSVDVVA